MSSIKATINSIDAAIANFTKDFSLPEISENIHGKPVIQPPDSIISFLSSKDCIFIRFLVNSLQKLCLLMPVDSETPVLSVKEENSISKSLQFLIALGICPCLNEGVGIPLSKRVSNSKFLSQICCKITNKEAKSWQLTLCIRCVLQMSSSHSILKSLVISQCLNDLLAGYFQLCSDQDSQCSSNLQEEFDKLVSNLYKPVLMRELIILQTSSPNWLKLSCGNLLSKLLTEDCGLLHLIQTMDDLGGPTVIEDWKKAESLANIIAKVPKQWKNREKKYYDNISHQLFKLLSEKFSRLVAVVALKMNKNSEPLLDLIFNPLVTQDGNESRSITMIFALCSGLPPNEKLVPLCNHLERNSTKIFAIFSDIQDSVSNLRNLLSEIICYYIKIQESEFRGRKLLEFLDQSASDKEYFVNENGLGIRERSEDSIPILMAERHLTAVQKIMDIFVKDGNTELLTDLLSLTNQQVDGSFDSNSDQTKHFIFLEKSKDHDLRQLTLMSLFSVIIENYMDKLLEKPENLMPIIVTVLQRPYPSSEKPEETLSFVFGIISMITLDSNISTKCDLSQLVPSLKKLSQTFPGLDLREKAKQLVALIEELYEMSNTTSKDKEEWTFDKLLAELSDPLVPTRGHALIQLKKCILAKDRRILDQKDQIGKILKSQLDHEDSYIFLSAINAFASLAALYPDQFLPILIELFTDWNTESKSVDLRVKVGEVLTKVCKELGELAGFYSNQLIGPFLVLCRSDDSIVRASSLSALAELCSLMSHKLTVNLQELLSCASQLMISDSQPIVRRAAIHLVRAIFRGAGSNMLSVFQDSILVVYRTMKQVYKNDLDMIVRLHAQLCLEEINDNMKSQFDIEKSSLIKEIKIK